MMVVLANAPMPACSPRSLTTLQSFRKLALATPPDVYICRQKSVHSEIPFTRQSKSNGLVFRSSCSWPTISRNYHLYECPRLSSISATPSGRLSPFSVKDLHSPLPSSANFFVSYFRECTHPIGCAKFGYRTDLDARIFSFNCYLPAVSIRWSRRIASRCRGSKQQAVFRNVFKGKLLSCSSQREKEEKPPQARSLVDGAGRAASSKPIDKDSTQLQSRWIRSEEVDNAKRKRAPSENAFRKDSRADSGTNQFARNGAVTNAVGSVSAAKGYEDTSEVGGQKRAAFEQWAVHKLKEDGPSALPAIEEMRQTFAPGSARLDPRVALSEIDSQPNFNVERNNKCNHAGSGKGSLSSPVPERQNTDLRLRGVRHLAGVQRGSPISGAEDSRSEFVTRSNTRVESWSPKSTTTSRARFERNVASKHGVQFSTEGNGNSSGERSTAGQSDASAPPPLLVKRKTKLPVNWNGRAGTVMLVDKPQGWTSFAVCAKLRYLLKIQKVGHAGTLDPMATGLLIVCLGKATKLADSYQAMTKVYSGTIRLGEITPSLDAFTEVSDVLPWEHITDEELERAKQDFVGNIFQKPPMYSAIKVSGERLYVKARRGEVIEVPPRLVTVTDFQLERSSENRQDIHFKVTCSKGTYVRSLCADLARAVGSYAHLTALRREKIGTYSVKDAWPILQFMEQFSQITDDIKIRGKV